MSVTIMVVDSISYLAKLYFSGLTVVTVDKEKYHALDGWFVDFLKSTTSGST